MISCQTDPISGYSNDSDGDCGCTIMYVTIPLFMTDQLHYEEIKNILLTLPYTIHDKELKKIKDIYIKNSYDEYINYKPTYSGAPDKKETFQWWKSNNRVYYHYNNEMISKYSFLFKNKKEKISDNSGKFNPVFKGFH